MTELDDGRSRIGTEPGSEGLSASATPSNPTPTTPEQIPTLTPAPAQMQEPIESTHAAAQANSDAAITLVKEYPLDGSRGSVGQWLQYSYTATPDAGSEDWSASETSDKTYLVEYRFTPSARGAAGVHYLFEADMEHGFVIGKNLDAKNMLGGIDVKQAPKKARPAAAKHKSPAARRITSPRASQRTRRNDHPGRVPLLPLPSESELRPPSQDEGGFMPDTVNSDI